MAASISLSILQNALPGTERLGDSDPLIRHITQDSRLVKQGTLFVCLPGETTDGHEYISQALQQGAAAVAVQRSVLNSGKIALPTQVNALVVPDTRTALPLWACSVYGNPSHSMLMIGVTGTNGKTTTTRMAASILRQAGMRTGTIGTLGTELDGIPFASEHTTPQADQLQQLLAEMRDAGAQAVAMEVSSHALALHRTDGIAFNAGIFTNLTRDHLDFHGTMQAYFDAKAILFSQYPVKYPRPDGRMFAGAVNVSQWEGRDMVTMVRGDVITFASEEGDPAVLTAKEIECKPASTRFMLCYDSGVEVWQMPIHLAAGGRFQVGNALGAAAACLRLGIAKETVAAGLAAMPPVPGRFEWVDTAGGGYSVIVDYAHTPDGLENLLRSARALNPSRIICLFGCGGNRDRTKRPIMGRLAAELADAAILTSDNPRDEDPDEILKEVLEGMEQSHTEKVVEPDRKKAIQIAIDKAQHGDIVLLAGKGHEDYQIVRGEKRHFDDREEALLAVRNRKESGR